MVEREFLSKVTEEELLIRIIRAHLDKKKESGCTEGTDRVTEKKAGQVKKDER